VQVAELPVQFWRSLAVFTVLMVARFSEAFVFLRASSVGVPFAAIPVFAMANNLVQVFPAPPEGERDSPFKSASPPVRRSEVGCA
jgi:hypothetical protein